MPVLQVTDLHKSYGDLHAVRGISFSIEPGEVFGLLGPNGAGKSTTINIIANLLLPDAGTVSLNGVFASASPAYKHLLGYVPQDISLTGRLTARENLMFVGRLYGLRGRVLRQRVDKAFDEFGLADRADDLVATFSGGMKRRMNIAAALLHNPTLILLDEPTTGVDPQARAHIFDTIERLAREGRAVLYTTHYMEEAQRLCHRTAIIDHGKILVIGTLDELVKTIKGKRELVLDAVGITTEQAGCVASVLGGVPFVVNGREAHFNVQGDARDFVDVVRAASDAGMRLTGIRINEPNLETVFLELTGRALRD